MKNQIKSTQSRQASALALAWIPSALASLALAAGGSAQTLHPVHTNVQVRPAAIAIPVGPLLPDDLVRFNVLHGYTPADIAAAYGVDALHREGWTGQGQTIVIVVSYGSPTALQDLQTFSTRFGLPVPDLTVIYPDGQPSLNSSDKLSWVGETSLDLQWAHAIAPAARLVLIAANPSETAGVHGFPGMFKGIQYAIANYPGSPISQSFACAEQSFDAAAAVLLPQYEAIYQEAVAAGCTPLAATGDDGPP